jgi:hypothetical protein
LAALLTVASLFPTSFQSEFAGSFNVGSNSGAMVVYLFLAFGFGTGACLLGSARTRASGASLLLVVVATFMTEKVAEIHFVTVRDVPIDPGVGFWLSQLGFLFGTLGALVGFMCLRDKHQAAAAEASGGIVVLAAVLGFATSVGWVMNYVSSAGGGAGSPIVGTPRTTWSEVVAFIAVPIGAVIAIKARRQLALGVTSGLAVFVLGIGLSRLLYAFQGAHNIASEGTWTFIAAGGALLILLGVRLIQTGERPVLDVICGEPA